MIRIATKLAALAAVIHLSGPGGPRDLAAQGPSSFCPSATDVAEAAGFAVRAFPQGTFAYGPAEMCAYQATDSPGTFVSISVQPHDPVEDPITALRSDAELMSGSPAEVIDVGDGGYAYGSTSKSEAAARKGDRVFHVEIVATGSGVANGKAAVIALLRRVVR